MQKALQILGPYQSAEKVVEHKGDSDTNHSWSPWNSPKETGKNLRSKEELWQFRPQYW